MPNTNKIQRTSEWDEFDESAMLYHLRQWEQIKESSKSFEVFVKDALLQSQRVIDIGCGAGASTFYIASNNPQVEVVGLDYSEELISIANKIVDEKTIKNLSFHVDNWYDLKQYENVDGVISLQTLSWLPDFKIPMLEIFDKIKPKWIAITSLFYEGDISCTIEVEEHKKKKKCFYNVYSIPEINRYCNNYGYEVVNFQPFHIPIDLEMPADKDHMGTYTIMPAAEDGIGTQRLQVSGPLLMNWYDLLISRR